MRPRDELSTARLRRIEPHVPARQPELFRAAPQLAEIARHFDVSGSRCCVATVSIRWEPGAIVTAKHRATIACGCGNRRSRTGIIERPARRRIDASDRPEDRLVLESPDRDGARVGAFYRRGGLNSGAMTALPFVVIERRRSL